MAESAPVLAVDVGGTKLAAAVVLPSGLVVGTGGGAHPAAGGRGDAVDGADRAARVLPAGLGAETGLLGAAALVLAGDRYWTGD